MRLYLIAASLGIIAGAAVDITYGMVQRHNTCMSQIEGALETAEQHRLTMERLRDEYWIIRKEPGSG